MPGADPNTRKHFDFKEEAVTNAKAKSKTRTRVDCHYCNMLRAVDGLWLVFSSLDRLRCHLTGDAAICKEGVDGKGNGGIGPCPNVSEAISDEFIVIVRTRQSQIQQRKDAKVKAQKIKESLKATRRLQAQQAGKEPDEDDEATTGAFTPLPGGDGQCKAFQSRKRQKANRAVAEFFYENPTIPPHVLRKTSFRVMIKAAREAPAGWVPPAPKYVLSDRLDERRSELQKEVCCHSLCRDPVPRPAPDQPLRPASPSKSTHTSRAYSDTHPPAHDGRKDRDAAGLWRRPDGRRCDCQRPAPDQRHAGVAGREAHLPGDRERLASDPERRQEGRSVLRGAAHGVCQEDNPRRWPACGPADY